MSLNSPIFEHAGQLANSEDSTGNVCSYASIHTDMAAQSKVFDDRYAKFVVDYVVDWERILTNRISAGLKREEQLRIELDHYQRKVEGMRVTANVTLAKGKMVDPKTAEKLSRNEEKLLNSRKDYEIFKNSLCLLIDETTLRSWKDLHPLLVKMTQFDVTMARAEAKVFSQLDAVINNLKTFADQNNLTGESRLSNVESMNPYELSGTTQSAALQLEYGTSPTNSMGGASTNWDGGMQAANNNHGFDFMGTGGQQNNWNQSMPYQNQSPYSNDPSLGMLDIASRSAPPPTFDTLTESTQALSLSQNNHSNNSYSTYNNHHTHNGGNYSDPFGSAPVPGIPTAPPPQMPPPVPPPPQVNTAFAQRPHQKQYQQQYNQLSLSSHSQHSSGYNNYNISNMNHSNSQGNFIEKNPFDDF